MDKPVDYRVIKAAGQFWRTPRDHVNWQVEKAREEGAPQDAYDRHELRSATALVEKYGFPITDRAKYFVTDVSIWQKWPVPFADAEIAPKIDEILAGMPHMRGVDVPEHVTASIVVGCGAIGWCPWWSGYEQNWTVADEHDYQAPDGWIVHLEHTDPDDPDAVPEVKVITHEKIMRAVRLITDPDSGVGNGVQLRDKCYELLSSPEDADFDAEDADAVLQIVAFGEGIYG